MDELSRRQFAMTVSAAFAAVAVPRSATQAMDRTKRFAVERMRWHNIHAMALLRDEVVATVPVTCNISQSKILCGQFPETVAADSLKLVDMYGRIVKQYRLGINQPAIIQKGHCILKLLDTDACLDYIKRTTQSFEVCYRIGLHTGWTVFDCGPITPAGTVLKTIQTYQTGTITHIIVDGVSFPVDKHVLAGEQWFLSANARTRVFGFNKVTSKD